MGIAVTVDGVLTAPEKATVSVFDHGFLFGDSVYEVVRTRRGVPVTMDEHLDRLRASAAMVYMDLPWDRATLGRRVREAVAAGGNAESYVRIIVSRGTGEISLLPDSCGKPVLVLLVKPLPVPPPEVARDGIPVVLSDRRRNDARALDPAAKTGNYLNNLLALVEAKRRGADDAVMRNTDGFLAEGTTSNVFWVKGGVVRTPSLDCGVLAGITRDVLLAALRRTGVPVEEGRYPQEALRGADEVFLTSTIRGVAPVTRLDGEPVGGGRPGPRTRRCAELYEEELDRRADEVLAAAAR
jgi:branched-chain amino acid aminotransferase